MLNFLRCVNLRVKPGSIVFFPSLYLSVFPWRAVLIGIVIVAAVLWTGFLFFWLLKRLGERFRAPEKRAMEYLYRPIVSRGRAEIQQQDAQHWAIAFRLQGFSFWIVYQSNLQGFNQSVVDKHFVLKQLAMSLPDLPNAQLRDFEECVRFLTSEYGGRVHTMPGKMVWESPIRQPGDFMLTLLYNIIQHCPLHTQAESAFFSNSRF